MEKYVNNVEKELLSLIRYHRNHFNEMKNKLGFLFPDDAVEIIKYLDKNEDLVWSIAKKRKEKEEAKAKQKEIEKTTPLLTICPECELGKERIPTGEGKNPQGYMANYYHCDECGADYINAIPNNTKEQLAWIEDFEAFIKENKKEINALPDELRKNILNIIEEKKSIKEIYKREEAVLKREKLIEKSEQIRDKYIEKCRDYLLVAKLKGEWGDAPIGEC